MLQDVHVHLQDAPLSVWESILNRADKHTRGRFFCNATSPDDWGLVKCMSEEFSGVIPFFGIHPWYVGRAKEGWRSRLEKLLLDVPLSGIGEIGLDKGPKGGEFEPQIIVFNEQIETAMAKRRPFILHCVHAWDEVLKRLRDNGGAGVPFIAHGFSGSEHLAMEIVSLGGYIAVSFRLFESKHRAILKILPKDRLLIETDFPYHKRRERDLPLSAEEYFHFLEETYRETAKALDVSVNELEEIVYHNGSVFADQIDTRG